MAAAHAGGQARDGQVGLRERCAVFEFGTQSIEALRDLLFGGVAIQTRMQRDIGALQYIDIGEQRRACERAVAAQR